MRAVIFGIVKFMGREAVQDSLGAGSFWRMTENSAVYQYRAMEGVYLTSAYDAATRSIQAAEERRIMGEHAMQALEVDEAEHIAERWAGERTLQCTIGYLPLFGQLICGGLSAVLMRQSTVELNREYKTGYHSSIDEFWDMVIDAATN